MKEKEKKSLVWSYFDVSPHTQAKALCRLCNKAISRGGSGKNASTKPLRDHLQFKHDEEFKEMKRQELVSLVNAQSSSKTVKLKQPTLLETLQKKALWDINDHRSRELHYLIAEMMALDNQPFSIVEDRGFTRLMNKIQPKYKIPGRKYFTEKVIPDIYQRCHVTIQDKLNSAEYVSLTSDIWTASNTNQSYISLTAHWINNLATLDHAMLNASHFPESHTGENIKKILLKMIDDWNLTSGRIHLLIRDNGPNMVKGAEDSGLSHEGCFIHTLQLAIKDSINSQRAIHDMIAISRKIITHFNHSSVACTRLSELQTQLGSSHKKLIQDVATWMELNIL